MSVGKNEAPAEAVAAPQQQSAVEKLPDGTDSGHDSSASATPECERAQTPQDAVAAQVDSVALGEAVYRFKVCAPNAEPFELQMSTAEMFQEIYQVLLDRESTCHRTCFSLQLDGKRLDNFTEIRNVEGIKDGSVLHVVEDPYTVREVRIHLRHVRDLIKVGEVTAEAACGVEGQSLSFLPSLNLLEKKPETKGIDLPPDYILPGAKERPLTAALPVPQKQQPALLNMALSPYNPPAGPRKMKGDLLYIDVETVERRRIHITASTKGFYVNASTEEAFKPTQSGQQKFIYHSIVELLNAVSPGFKRAYAALIKRRAEKHVLDRLATPYPVASWLAPPAEYVADGIRAEDATQPHRIGFEDHFPGQLRDWNEELQTTHELPRGNLAERIVRDRSVFKIHGDFIMAAVKGAMAVVDGNVASINPADDPKTHMFIWNNIFFSLGFDVKDHYKELGGDAAAHAATSADLQGVRIYSSVDDPKLCTLGMAVVDYKGYRVTAQSIIPGILEKEQDQSVVYGSYDFGKTVVSHEKYVELLEKTAEELKILPHEVISTDKDGNEKTVKLYTSFETKGIIGNDGRTYVLDLLRTMPPDVHYLDDAPVSQKSKEKGYPRKFPHKLAVLRQELVEAFVEYRYLKFIRVAAFHVQEARLQEAQARLENQQENATETTEAAVSDEESKLPDAEDAQKIVDEAIPSKEEAEISKKSQEVLAKAAVAVGSLSDTTFDIRFNPDCLSPTVVHAPSENLEKQKQLLVDAAEFLLAQQLPTFVQECLEFQLTPIDGEGLCELMHSKGINLRYMGEVMKAVVETDSYMKPLVAGELVARSAKHVIRKVLQEVTAEQMGVAVAHILNALLGSIAVVAKDEKSKKTKRGGRKGEKWADVSTKSLWTAISEEATTYYGFTLNLSSTDDLVETFGVQRVSLFRRMCRILGIQMLAKDYALEKRAAPFVEDDVQNTFPVFKHKQPWARDAKHLYMRAQAETSQGRLRDAYECVAEAVSLMTSVYGAMHGELAQALRLLARLSYIMGEPGEALAQQHKAALMSERCNGIDHALTIVEYLNLAHFAFANLYVSAALRLLYRARFLLLVAHGENHPLMSQIDGNIGIILFAVQEYDLAVKFLSAAEASGTAHGEPKRMKNALLSHMLARAHSCRGDFRAALTAEKETYTIYTAMFGAAHDRTRESGECLKHLTQQAVEFQKRMNEVARGNGIQQLLPPQAPPPSLSAVLEVMNVLNGIIIITMPAATSAAAGQEAVGEKPSDEAVKAVEGEKPAMQDEALD